MDMDNDIKPDMRDKVVVLLAGGRLVQRRADTGESPHLSVEELAEFLPEDVRSQAVFLPWSISPISTYSLRLCSDILHLAASYIHNDGAAGIVVTCGMSAISELVYYADLVWNLNPPIIFTSSIFHADSVESETSYRLTQCIRAVRSDFCAGKGALLCVQDALYAPSDVLYISSSDRFGVHAVPNAPLAMFLQPNNELLPLRMPNTRIVQNTDVIPARNIVILEASLGTGDLLLKSLLEGKWQEELDGLVISGFGDGNVPPSWMPHLRKLLRLGIPIVLTSRCPGGVVQITDNFEGSAAQLLEMGVIRGGALSPLQARLRLAIGIGIGLKGENLSHYIWSKN